MFKSTIILFFLFWVFFYPLGKASIAESIRWLSFEEAIKLNKVNPKKIYIDVYTDWCGWCKRMDQTSFTDAKVIQEMNANYYAVKLNAETKDSILFQNHSFKFLPAYKANELALALLDGKMGFPTTVLMDKNQKIITRIPGYLKGNQLSEILHYFGKDLQLTATWNQYQKSLGHDTLPK